MNKKQTESYEPYYFIGLVLRGTEKQYTRMLKYIGSRNGAQVIYQCKSLTYLHLNREDAKFRTNSAVADIEKETISSEA